jgi:hypothetical protein
LHDRVIERDLVCARRVWGLDGVAGICGRWTDRTRHAIEANRLGVDESAVIVPTPVIEFDTNDRATKAGRARDTGVQSMTTQVDIALARDR